MPSLAISSDTLLTTLGVMERTAGTTTSSARHCRCLAYAKSATRKGKATDSPLTHTENGTVNTNRESTVHNIIVVE